MITKDYLIDLLHTVPSSDKDLGWNAALIAILKKGSFDTRIPCTAGSKIKSITDIGIETFNGLSLNIDDLLDIQTLIREGSMLGAVKKFKDITRWGLKESKEAIERFRDNLNQKY